MHKAGEVMSSQDIAGSAHPAADPTAAMRRRVVFASTLGNAFEWFDYGIFGMFAPIISKLFFPAGSELTSMLLTFATFAVAFAMRPLSGVLFGLYADRLGRKRALTLMIIMMAVGTGMIGLLPTYAAIGIAAPLLMVVASRLHRILDRLDEDLLASADQVLDAATVALALELGADDLVDVEEAVLLQADLDKRRLHAGEDIVDDALVDVAGDRTAAGPLEVDLGDAVVLEHRDTLLAHVDGDEQLTLRGRQGPAGLLAAARLGAARALLARSGGLLRPVLLRFRGRPGAAGGRCLGLGRGGRSRRFRGGALPPFPATVSAAAPATGRLSALGGGIWLCYSSRAGVLRFGDCFDRGRLGAPSTASEPRQWQVNSPSWEARARPKAVTRRVVARSAFRSDNNG